MHTVEKHHLTTSATAPNVAYISVIVYLWSVFEKQKINFGPLLSRQHQIGVASNVVCDFFVRCIVSYSGNGLQIFINVEKAKKGEHNGWP